MVTDEFCNFVYIYHSKRYLVVDKFRVSGAMEVRGAVFIRPALVAAAIVVAAVGSVSPVYAKGGSDDCPAGDYLAASGDCVPYPAKRGGSCPNPTAICADGDYSCSEHPYSGGTCHGHGGVQTHLT
jgi:hypothetical protein